MCSHRASEAGQKLVLEIDHTTGGQISKGSDLMGSFEPSSMRLVKQAAKVLQFSGPIESCCLPSHGARDSQGIWRSRIASITHGRGYHLVIPDSCAWQSDEPTSELQGTVPKRYPIDIKAYILIY